MQQYQKFNGKNSTEVILTLTIIIGSFFQLGSSLIEGVERKPYFQRIWGDVGANLTIPCGGKVNSSGSAMWIRHGKSSVTSFHVLKDGSISFDKLKPSDAGLYTCILDEDISYKEASNDLKNEQFTVNVTIRTAPKALRNVMVKSLSVFAWVVWETDESTSGGYPIQSFQIKYKLKSDSNDNWKYASPKFISPILRQSSLRNLQPNSSYVIELWANNKLGKGSPTILKTCTRYDRQEIELMEHWTNKGNGLFDVRIWLIAVSVVIVTIIILVLATCYLCYKEKESIFHLHGGHDWFNSDGENIELMPNIILNPGYDIQYIERQQSDENCNRATMFHLNNNSVIHPTRV